MPKSPAAPSIRLGILGPATLGIGDEPARLFKGRRPLRVLAYLLLHRRNPVLRERAASELWPDHDKEAAHANLRRHLYLLAQALPPSGSGEPWILGESDRVQVNGNARIFVDADEFEALATRGACELAAARYGGDLFVTLDDTWVESERERLRSLYVTALSELVPLYRRRRDFTRAVQYAQQLLVTDPWREDVLRQLMSVRYEAGDAAGAVSEYDAFARRLRRELSVDPMLETNILRETIVSGRALDGAPTPLVAEVTTPARRTAHELPFAGREADLAAFTTRWNDAARGRGGVVAVSGEAGIGKTRLVREMGAYASAQGGRVLFGTTAYPELQPYEAFAEALRSALKLVTQVDAPHAIATLAQIVPELSEKQFDLQAFASVEPSDRQRRLFDAIAAILGGLARPRPVLIILEDLHWAGSGTLAALQYVASRIARAPVLIVATYREEEVDRLHGLRTVFRALRAANLLTEFSPGPLTEGDVIEIVTHIASVEGDKVSIARRLFERSEGNPLFLSEIVDAMADSPAEPAAATLQMTIEARVARLSPAAKSFVEIASAAGSGFDVEVIREVTGWTGSQATGALDELLSRGLVRELPGHHGLAFSFSHQLVQEAIYGGIGASDRIARHRRIARVVEELYADRLEDFSRDLARHYDIAGEPRTAARYYLLAAHRAAELYADDEAIDAADRALERTPHGRARRDILLLREAAFGRRGRRSEQHDDLDELDAIAAEHADGDLAWQVLRRRCLLARAEGDVDVERASIGLLTAQARAAGNIAWEAEAMKHAATFSLVTDYDYERCNAAAATALELRDRLGDTTGAIEVLCILAQNEMHGGSWERARRFAEDAHGRATTEQNTAVVARATIALAQAALPRQEFAAYREMAGRALTMFRAIGDVENEAAALNGIGNACTHLGELAAAREHLTRAADLFQSIGVRRGVTVALINVGVIDWALGRLDRAYAAISQARQEAMELGFSIGSMIAATDLSGIARMLHRFDEASELADEVVAQARRSKLPLYEAAGLAQAAATKRARGDLAGAIGDLEAAVALFDGLQHPADEVEARAELAASYLEAGEIDKAVAMTRAFLALPREALIAGTFPQALHLIAARVYDAAGLPDLYRAHVEAASRFVEKRLEQCTDDDSNATFSQLPVNISIAEAARNLR